MQCRIRIKIITIKRKVKIWKEKLLKMEQLLGGTIQKRSFQTLRTKNDTLTCVVKRNGCLSLSVWNQYYQVWDDEFGDDCEMSKETELEWFSLDTMEESEIIKL